MPEAPFQTPQAHPEVWVRPAPTRIGLRGRLMGLVALGLMASIAGYYFLQRSQTLSGLKMLALEEATPSVSVISPAAGPTMRTLTLPGDVHAWFQAPIFGQVSGYVKMWYKDIGAPVRRGELLATIDTPGLDQQLQESKAQLAVAQANYELARVTAARWEKLSGTQAVAQQDIDVKRADAQAREAQVAAAQYNLARFQAMEGFKNIVAPFDGIVTTRRTDVGDYVTAGGGDAGRSGQAQELFSVADIHAMRVYVSVPQDYSSQLKPGLTATLTLPQFPGVTFKAHDLTTSGAVDPASRTVLTQLVVDNPRGEILPGAYADVKFQIPSDPSIVTVPEQALLFRAEGMQVARLEAGDKIHLQDVTLGRNFGGTVQITEGLAKTDRIVANPSQGLLEGEAVRVVSTPPQNSNDVAVTQIRQQEGPHVEPHLGE